METTATPLRSYRAARAKTYVTAPGAPAVHHRSRAAAARLEEAGPAALTHGQEILERTGLPASAPVNSLRPRHWEEPARRAKPPLVPGTRRLEELTPEQLRIAESRLYWLSKVHHKSPEEISAELDLKLSELEPLSQSRALNR